MLVNTAMWNYLRLDDQDRLFGASACAYIGMTPERIKALLDCKDDLELMYNIGLARDLGFNPDKDLLRVID